MDRVEGGNRIMLLSGEGRTMVTCSGMLIEENVDRLITDVTEKPSLS